MYNTVIDIVSAEERHGRGNETNEELFLSLIFLEVGSEVKGSVRGGAYGRKVK